jgi:hypothetical protein
MNEATGNLGPCMSQLSVIVTNTQGNKLVRRKDLFLFTSLKVSVHA